MILNTSCWISSLRHPPGLSNIIHQAETDSLTGLFNRRYYNELASEIIEQSMGDTQPVSFIMADIDYFKAYNDTHGHDAGDKVLRKVSEIFTKHTREQDIVVRWGGEEFVILLPGINLSQATEIAFRLKNAFYSMNYTSTRNNKPIQNTISFGISSIPDPSVTKEELEKHADIALYDAKKIRNNIVVFQKNVIGVNYLPINT